ncbi:ATP/GTP-binding protein [uncultured Tateyamaria sp.]|uniref:AAA family ATPase n=1 Tax=uncultured Tateyamaria sp. TaxID=455651 RepID=UPI002601F587|nr:ATP-binding protein [uncultured Tateyamaria sp.]
MLLSFSATNYKSISDTQTLSLVGSKLKGPREPLELLVPGGGNGVLPCAIIYGANAAGKSNLVNAMSIMRRLVLDSHRDAAREASLPARPFLLDDDYEGEPTAFEVSFMVDSIRYDYGFSFDESQFLEEWLFSFPEGRRRKLFEREDGSISFGSGMKGEKRSLERFLRENALFLSIATQNKHEELSAVFSFFEDMFFSNRISVGGHVIDAAFKENEIDERTIRFLEAIGTGVVGYQQTEANRPDEIKAMLTDFRALIEKHAEPSDPSELPDVEEKEFKIELGHLTKAGEKKFFAGSLESAGTRRLLVIMNRIFEVLDKGQVAIIDELDASLHSVAVKAMLALFFDPTVNKNNAQLIATTHDTNLLDPEFLRRDEIWFVEKEVSGESQYFSLAEIVARKGEVFEKSYLAGRYGALPVMPDFSDLQMKSN